MKGIEIEGFAVALARLTLWMGHKLSVDELGLAESTLPLRDLSGIQVADALRIGWPRADAIIGNPPFHGTKHMRSLLGDDYVEWLKQEFGIGVKDYCVYWFRKAHDQLDADKRAGLVGTNSIAEGRNREVSLKYIADDRGVITSAVSNQSWPGEANVHVCIVNWIKEPASPPSAIRLDGSEVRAIGSRLRAGSEDGVGEPLAANAGKQFYGVVPTGEGFILEPWEAQAILDRYGDGYREVVRPYLIGDDITSSPGLRPSRWIIDFGERALEEAMQWPAALELVRARVKPARDRHRKARERTQWWKFSRTVQEMFRAITNLHRFVASPAQSKRFYMVWCGPDWCPSNLTSVFAFEDDFSIGVLTSGIHLSWAMSQSTRLKSDPRYTTASFMTFPWPDGSRNEIADVIRRLYARRSEICIERQVGLTKLYNQMDDGAWADLRQLHRELDEAVAAAYGWPRSIAQNADETHRRLLELNRVIAAGTVAYDPFR
jgi:hypothetical protein